MINEIIEAILRAQSDPAQLSQIASLSQSITKLDDDEVDQLVARILDFGDELAVGNRVEAADHAIELHQLIQPVIHQLVQRDIELIARNDGPPSQSRARLEQIRTLYRLAPNDSDLRNHLLRWLAVQGTDDAIDVWADLICDDPPEHRLGIVLAFSPLMQPSFEPSQAMLDQLISNAIGHSQIAPAVFDLLNYYYRHEKIDTHPAHERVDSLTVLLGQVVGQLGKIEEGNFPKNFGVSQINQLVSDSVSLIVSLCDTFAQLEHQAAIGKLHQALGLRHRRVQTEAAAALAKLGDEQGKQSLIDLAQQPVARLRVLAYAEELGFKNDISLELQGEIATAESHLAIWLAEPEQMGLAPSDIEFLESREMYWPSYEHPVHCYLFKYFYGSGQQSHSNIGICGPMTHAFAADLQHLESDDLYALFAGWQTIHNEIFQVPIGRAERAFSNQWRRLVGSLDAEDFENVEPKTGASFFGKLLLIAEATQDGQPGTAVVSSEKVTWFSRGNADAPIDWELAYAIWRGRELLASFNQSESA